MTVFSKEAKQKLSTSVFTFFYIADNIPPEFNTCPSDIFNNTFTTAFLGISVSISWEEPTYDDEGGTVQLHKTHSTGDLFIVGEQTLVIYTLTDTAGNFATCAFVVTLLRKYRTSENEALFYT